MKNLKHRLGAALINFSVDRLLRRDVAKVFREQLNLGKDALIQRQKISVQLREDLRDAPLVCSCGYNPAHHFENISPEQVRRLLKQHARHHNQPLEDAWATGAPIDGTYTPDPHALPEGV